MYESGSYMHNDVEVHIHIYMHICIKINVCEGTSRTQITNYRILKEKNIYMFQN